MTPAEFITGHGHLLAPLLTVIVIAVAAGVAERMWDRRRR